MKTSIKVINLATSEEQEYHLTPEDAVKVAFVQANPTADIPTLCYGKLTVACGDWCAKL